MNSSANENRPPGWMANFRGDDTRPAAASGLSRINDAGLRALDRILAIPIQLAG